MIGEEKPPMKVVYEPVIHYVEAEVEPRTRRAFFIGIACFVLALVALVVLGIEW